MAGDLEDFLRRAAQQRQAKAAQQREAQQAQPARRVKPEYSNSRTERSVRSRVEPEEILVAEVIDEAISDVRDDENSIAARMRRVEQAKQRAKEAEQELARRKSKTRSRDRSSADEPVPSTGNTAQDLINNLRRPGGIQQAILLREILDRPEHRW